MSEVVKIVKVGAEPPKSTPPPVRQQVAGATRKRSDPGHRYKQPKHGVLKGGKTARAKIHAVRDPAKPPPVRKGTLKILTEKGAEKRRKHIRKTVRAMPDGKVRHLLKASGLPVSENTPPHIAKEILEGGMEAGMIVSG
jgi:hypothetical protein